MYGWECVCFVREKVVRVRRVRLVERERYIWDGEVV